MQQFFEMKFQVFRLTLLIVASHCLIIGFYPPKIKAKSICDKCISYLSSESFTALFGEIRSEDELMAANNNVDMNTYDKYRQLYQKEYSDNSTIARRFKLFKERVEYIVKSNLDYLFGKQPYYLNINRFADLELDEINYGTSQRSDSNGIEPPLTNGKDYRSTNCVSPVKHQGSCGCCYAFATLSVIETLICLNHKLNPDKNAAIDLAVQEVVDCFIDESGQKRGCRGGYPHQVMDYFRKQNYALKSSCYKYKAEENSCSRDKIIKQNYTCLVPIRDESDSIRVVYTWNSKEMVKHMDIGGTIAVTFYTSPDNVYYSGGILIEQNKSKRNNDTHAAVVVGYGHEDGLDYWLVKNSWGSDWGLGGYFKVARGFNSFELEQWGVGLRHIDKIL